MLLRIVDCALAVDGHGRGLDAHAPRHPYTLLHVAGEGRQCLDLVIERTAGKLDIQLIYQRLHMGEGGILVYIYDCNICLVITSAMKYALLRLITNCLLQ